MPSPLPTVKPADSQTGLTVKLGTGMEFLKREARQGRQMPEASFNSDGARQRIVIVPAAPDTNHLLQQLRVILLVVDEICLRGIHDQ